MTPRIVLAGAGHAHAQVLRAWRDAPVRGVELVVVSPHALAPYSGMVPGWLAGRYRFEEIVIDFEALCRAAGARWVPSAIERLDPDASVLRLEDGDSLRYDWLSLNVGSTLTPPQTASAATVLSMRPLSDLRSHYEQVLTRWRSTAGSGDAPPFRVTAVGAGAAGFESLLAVLRRLRTLRPDRAVHGVLTARSAELLPGYPGGARRRARTVLQEAGVQVRLGAAWTDAVARESDLVLWATGAQPHAWQRDPARRGRLSADTEGFVRIDACLRSVSHPNVFAAGDCAQWNPPLPKAGVYAVRMGPVLTHNLHAVMTGGPVERYVPQRHFLSLLATSDGRAIASRGPLSLSGRWACRLKDRIDRNFVRRFDPDGREGLESEGESR